MEVCQNNSEIIFLEKIPFEGIENRNAHRKGERGESASFAAKIERIALLSLNNARYCSFATLRTCSST